MRLSVPKRDTQEYHNWLFEQQPRENPDWSWICYWVNFTGNAHIQFFGNSSEVVTLFKLKFPDCYSV